MLVSPDFADWLERRSHHARGWRTSWVGEAVAQCVAAMAVAEATMSADSENP